MANIIDDICPEGSILDGFDDWPRSATRKEWFRITRELVAAPSPTWTCPLTSWLRLRRRSLALACCDLSPFPTHGINVVLDHDSSAAESLVSSSRSGYAASASAMGQTAIPTPTTVWSYGPSTSRFLLPRPSKKPWQRSRSNKKSVANQSLPPR